MTLKMYIPFGPKIALLGIYPKEVIMAMSKENSSAYTDISEKNGKQS